MVNKIKANLAINETTVDGGGSEPGLASLVPVLLQCGIHKETGSAQNCLAKKCTHRASTTSFCLVKTGVSGLDGNSLLGAGTCRQSGSGAYGHQDTTTQPCWLPRAPPALPRLLPERRTRPVIWVRFLSSVICRRENSRRSSIRRAVQQQAVSWPTRATTKQRPRHLKQHIP